MWEHFLPSGKATEQRGRQIARTSSNCTSNSLVEYEATGFKGIRDKGEGKNAFQTNSGTTRLWDKIDTTTLHIQ